MEQSLDETQEDSIVDNIVVTDQDGGSYNYENEEFCAEEDNEEDEDQHGEDVDEEDVSF